MTDSASNSELVAQFGWMATFAQTRCAPLGPPQFIRILSESGFSASDYSAANPVLTAHYGDDDSALRHFFRHGISERRFSDRIERTEAEAVCRVGAVRRASGFWNGNA